MRVTKRYWAVVSVTALLALLAIVLVTPALLVGAGVLSVWIVIEQYRFIHRLETESADISIETTLSEDRVPVNGSTTITLHVERSASDLDLEVALSTPTGATGPAATVSLPAGKLEGSDSVAVQWPLAGAYTFSAPTATFNDDRGFFEQSIEIGSTPTCVVEPYSPRSIHVGSGGDEVAATLGDHSARHGGSGLDPAELRKYIPGDPANRIDWKATARLNDTYVRQFEAQTDRETILLLDTRPSMGGEGPEGTKVDYLVDILLAMTDLAERLDDPLGLTTIEEDGMRELVNPSVSSSHYHQIKTQLHDIDAPTSETGARLPAWSEQPLQQLIGGSSLRRSTTAFGETLFPFLKSEHGQVERIADEPLFGALNRLSDAEERRLFVIATDDTHRQELTEAIKVATGRGNQVLLFMTVSALFEDYALAEMENTYEKYVAFEEFRRRIDRAPRTRAFEVGPGDRINAILRTARDRRNRETVA